MPTTRKKVIKTVYKDDLSDDEGAGDFSDSGSEAEIFEGEGSSSDENVENDLEEVKSSDIEDHIKPKQKSRTKKTNKCVRKPKFATNLISRISKQSIAGDFEDTSSIPFSVKDLTEADKLLPPVLQLSESDSSDDESPRTSTHQTPSTSFNTSKYMEDESDQEQETPDNNIWAKNIIDSKEAAEKAFKELEQHKEKLEEAKASLLSYKATNDEERESNVNDLLALGEEVLPETKTKKKAKIKSRHVKEDSDSDVMEDWEEVAEKTEIPQQGLQLVVDFPEACSRKKKEVDVEMMIKRKMNRVKKEHQIFMHKVHVLCWLGHGNYVSCVLNNQDILAGALSLVPSKECYPGERVDVKYVEQITTWYKDKLKLKQDKHEDKFKPKAPPLKEQLLTQIKTRIVTSKKYMVFIFVSMLRALGLQCRIMFNFVTVPIKPPVSEMCSLSTKPKDKPKEDGKNKAKSDSVETKKPVKSNTTNKSKSKKNIAQIDGTYDSLSDSDFDNIMQVDGNDDHVTTKTLRSARGAKTKLAKKEDEDVSPPKRSKKSLSLLPPKTPEKEIITEVPAKRKRTTRYNASPSEPEVITKKTEKHSNEKVVKDIQNDKIKPSRRSLRKPDVSEELTKESNEKSTPLKNQRLSLKSTKNKTQVNDSLQLKSSSSSNRRKINKELKEDHELKDIKNISDENKTQVNESLQLKTNSSSNRRRINKELKDDHLDTKKSAKSTRSKTAENPKPKNLDAPEIVVTEDNGTTSSKYFEDKKSTNIKSRLSLSRNRSQTNNPTNACDPNNKDALELKPRTRSAPNKSKYFDEDNKNENTEKFKQMSKKIKDEVKEDKLRVSHRDLKSKDKIKSLDIKSDLVELIKGRVKEAKDNTKKKLVKAKVKHSSGEDSDYLPEEEPKRRPSEDDFKPKVLPNSKLKKKLDRRVLSTDNDEEMLKKNIMNKINVWCEVFVEELEQWIAVDIIKGQVHCTNQIYNNATHPVAYIVGWDNNNYLKDLTRRYVPQWNTVTRKNRVEVPWWNTAIGPWLGPKTARDREEDESLDKMQLEAPLPASITEYKNHPLYALKRHLLKFEAIYPPDAAVLGYVRKEPVYARECVYICKSREIWLKDAKVVKIGEKPYKIVKKRKFDRVRNKLETDHPLEIFGPWQTQDYEPPVAENGVVPRNAYGNVELFQLSMLPKGTVHMKLPGLHKVAKKLNIDCATAITGFDFHGGWSHPVYDGYVVCEEFEELLNDAWIKDQEEQERRERERLEIRVFGNWKRLIKGLLIRERLKLRYGFEEPTTTVDKKKSKGPRLVVKKK